MLYHWHAALDNGSSTRVLFVDYAKAFDHVDHNLVVDKLKTFGLSEIITDWITSFLCDRQQRIAIDGYFSSWVSLRGGVPQGSWLGPLVFLILIDNLRPDLLTHKFVDDTTLSEVVGKRQVSQMQSAVDELINWSVANKMNINTRKTKEMVLGPLSRNPPVQTTIGDLTVERVSQFKLLGVIVNDSLKWNDHVATVCSKMNKRLYFLKQLKRAGMAPSDLLYFYQTVIRPVAEYACPVWHTSLTVDQTDRIEATQRRAVKIIYSDCDMVQLADLPLMADRREQLSRRFFDKICDVNSCLYHLLPAQRDTRITNSLRMAKKYPVPFAKSTRFQKSFIPYALANFQ